MSWYNSCKFVISTFSISSGISINIIPFFHKSLCSLLLFKSSLISTPSLSNIAFSILSLIVPLTCVLLSSSSSLVCANISLSELSAISNFICLFEFIESNSSIWSLVNSLSHTISFWFSIYRIPLFTGVGIAIHQSDTGLAYCITMFPSLSAGVLSVIVSKIV